MPAVAPISQQIWDMKYRLRSSNGKTVDNTIEDSWQRVAKTMAAAELRPNDWEDRFYEAMENFCFLPAGRILAGAGANRNVTLFNCFVMGAIPDDMSGIFDNLREAALTMQQGGGIGYDFSTLRPKGAPVEGVGADASGPLTFMDVWDAMCRTIMSAGHRRGAMMATLRCDHPDIETFIEAKQDPGRLRMFNLSVLVTDSFMQAVKNDEAWELQFDGRIYKSLQARELWNRIMRATYAYAEPGVVFIERINQLNNLRYCETINSTNPCGEQPLPPYGACLLGSINLARLVNNSFTAEATLNLATLRDLVKTAIRFLDNAIDISHFPLPEQEIEARDKRRIGLGITGLADALIFCRVRYGSDRAVTLTKEWLAEIRRAAYLTSIELAKEKGVFPLFDREAFLASENVANLDDDIRIAIAKHGIRNALLTSIAPTGTISIFADNVSSGLEPVFAFTYNRYINMTDGKQQEEMVSDYAYRQYKIQFGETAQLPEYFVTASVLTPSDHVRMQAAAQVYIDASISKTINLPEDITFQDFKDVYMLAYDGGCKGCTTYRPNQVTGAVLKTEGDTSQTLEPELPLKAPEKRPLDELDAGGVVYMTKPLDRPGSLTGSTYKINWPESDHGIYITINDIIQDGRVRPFEVFINSKNVDHFAWTVALTRMISAVFRRGGDVSFIVEELKAVFDPRGGYWIEGRYVPSLLAAIGEVIEKHMIEIGFITGPYADPEANAVPLALNSSELIRGENESNNHLRSCPKCYTASLIRMEGCDTCVSCGYSKCG